MLNAAADITEPIALELAMEQCVQSGESCAGVSCVQGNASACDKRRGLFGLQASEIEDTYVKHCVQDPLLQSQREKVLREKLLGGVSAMWTD
eukprot:2226680-Amphidinium_carterae.1